MELDQFKKEWEKVEPSKKDDSIFNKQKLQKLTHRKFTTNILKIAIPKILLSLLCIYGIVFFIYFQDLLDNGFQLFLANLGIVLFIVMPILSLYSIYQFYKIGKVTVAPAETLKEFKRQSIRFNKMQYLLLGINILLFSVCVVVVPLVYSENLSNKQLAITFTIGFILVYWVSRKLRNYYQNQIRKNEELLRSLDSDI